MGRPKISDGTPLAIRLDATTRERLEALRTTVMPGLEVPLSQVARAALIHGLDAMERAEKGSHPKGLQAGTGQAFVAPRQRSKSKG